MQKFHTLWNGIWEPEDITPEYVQSLSIPDALKLMYWMNNYEKEDETKKEEKESK